MALIPNLEGLLPHLPVDSWIHDALETPNNNVDPFASHINKKIGTTARFGMNWAIEKKAGLLFNYAFNPFEVAAYNKKDPSSKEAADRYSGFKPSKRWLPFYENPIITESRKANYASTPIFLRNEPVRLFTGAQAREFKVDVHYSIFHMAAMCPT